MNTRGRNGIKIVERDFEGKENATTESRERNQPCGSERLNRVEVAHERVLLDHVLHADSQSDGHTSGQALLQSSGQFPTVGVRMRLTGTAATVNDTATRS